MPCNRCCWRPWTPCATLNVDRHKRPPPALAGSIDTWVPNSSTRNRSCPGKIVRELQMTRGILKVQYLFKGTRNVRNAHLSYGVLIFYRYILKYISWLNYFWLFFARYVLKLISVKISMMKRTYFQDRLVVNEYGVICRSVNKSTPKDLVECYRHIWRRFNPL